MNYFMWAGLKTKHIDKYQIITRFVQGNRILQEISNKENI